MRNDKISTKIQPLTGFAHLNGVRLFSSAHPLDTTNKKKKVTNCYCDVAGLSSSVAIYS